MLTCTLFQEKMIATIWASLYYLLEWLRKFLCREGPVSFSEIPLKNECLEILNSGWLNISISLQCIGLLSISYTFLSLRNSKERTSSL